MSDLQRAVIDELRLCRDGSAPTMRELRLQLDCGAAELAAAVQALRYQGKLVWDRLELSPSMVAQSGGEEPPTQSAGAPPVAKDGPEGGSDGLGRLAQAPSGPDDDEDPDDGYPGEVNDRQRPLPAPAPELGGTGTGFVPKSLLVKAGVHAAQTRAAGRPVPPPSHEPEIARLVREEVEGKLDRRRRSTSTATVRQPLELQKFGVPDLSLGESIATLLAEDPQDVMRAIARKHPATWRRVIELARATGKTPMQTLYAALERGLDALEPTEVSDAA